MPITNIFATWNLSGGGGEEDSAVVVQPKPVAATFVKPRDTGCFFQSTATATAAAATEASLSLPPGKLQKVIHSDKAQKQPLPVPQHISVMMAPPSNLSSSTTVWQYNGRELESLSGDDDDDDDDDDLSQSSKCEDGIKPRELLPAPFFRYRDHSQDVDEDPLLPLTPFSKIPNFPAKLHAILSRPDLADVISWRPHGRSWRVLKPRDFEIRVLPSYFEHQKLSSFIRQANGWGFHRVSQGMDRNSYYHELFVRGLPHLCKKMRRPRVNEKPVVDPDHEPDFYAISDMHPLPAFPKDKSLQNDILLPVPATWTAGGEGTAKTRMQVQVDKEELRSAVSKALAGSTLPPGLDVAKPSAVMAMGVHLPSFPTITSSLLYQPSLGTAPPRNAATLLPSSHLLLPQSVQSLISSGLLYPPKLAAAYDYDSTMLSWMNSTTIQSNNPGATAGITNSSLDPLSNLILLLKQDQQQLQQPSSRSSAYEAAASSFGNNPLFHSNRMEPPLPQQQQQQQQQASEAASLFAAGFAAATAFHTRQFHHRASSVVPGPFSSSNLLDPVTMNTNDYNNNNNPVVTRKLELDAAAAMSLLENSCVKKTV